MSLSRDTPANPDLDRRSLLRLHARLFNRISAMTIADIAELLGYLAAAWSVGFCAGYLYTWFKRGVDQIV